MYKTMFKTALSLLAFLMLPMAVNAEPQVTLHLDDYTTVAFIFNENEETFRSFADVSVVLEGLEAQVFFDLYLEDLRHQQIEFLSQRDYYIIGSDIPELVRNSAIQGFQEIILTYGLGTVLINEHGEPWVIYHEVTDEPASRTNNRSVTMQHVHSPSNMYLGLVTTVFTNANNQAIGFAPNPSNALGWAFGFHSHRGSRVTSAGNRVISTSHTFGQHDSNGNHLRDVIVTRNWNYFN